MKISSIKRKIQIGRSSNGSFLYFPLGLVLAPTRELAIQIYNASALLASKCGLRISVVYGGAKKDCQLGEMSQGVDVLIATPGRLIDFLSCGTINLSAVSFFVLDEADRMLVSSGLTVGHGFLPAGQSHRGQHEQYQADHVLVGDLACRSSGAFQRDLQEQPGQAQDRR